MNMLCRQIRLLGFRSGIAAWWRIRRHRSWTCPIDDRECGSDCMFWPRGCTESRRHNDKLRRGCKPSPPTPCSVPDDPAYVPPGGTCDGCRWSGRATGELCRCPRKAAQCPCQQAIDAGQAEAPNRSICLKSEAYQRVGDEHHARPERT